MSITRRYTQGSSFLVRVTMPNFCAGCVITDGIVTAECAPILRKWIGQRGRALVEWCRVKGGTATWQQINT